MGRGANQGQPTWTGAPRLGPPSMTAWIESSEVPVIAALSMAITDQQGDILTDPLLNRVYDIQGEQVSGWTRPHAPPWTLSTPWDRRIP
jgi:hypothetical protein